MASVIQGIAVQEQQVSAAHGLGMAGAQQLVTAATQELEVAQGQKLEAAAACEFNRLCPESSGCSSLG